MGARCKTCGLPLEDHPSEILSGDQPCNVSWAAQSLQNQIDQMGLHIQAMKIKVSEPPAPVLPTITRKYYLACPYTHKNPAVQWVRTDLASQVAAYLMSHETVVFSPITHGHGIAPHMDKGLAASHEFWMCQCLPMLEWADDLVLLPLAGWRESRGVQRELLHAKANGKSVIVIQLPGNPMCELFASQRELESAGLFGALMEIM